jgi:hypothetical protein
LIPQLEKCGHEYQTTHVLSKIALLSEVISENQHRIFGFFFIDS